MLTICHRPNIFFTDPLFRAIGFKLIKPPTFNQGNAVQLPLRRNCWQNIFLDCPKADIQFSPFTPKEGEWPRVMASA